MSNSTSRWTRSANFPSKVSTLYTFRVDNLTPAATVTRSPKGVIKWTSNTCAHKCTGARRAAAAEGAGTGGPAAGRAVAVVAAMVVVIRSGGLVCVPGCRSGLRRCSANDCCCGCCCLCLCYVAAGIRSSTRKVYKVDTLKWKLAGLVNPDAEFDSGNRSGWSRAAGICLETF